METDHKVQRLVALFASVFISLVAGTPYLYGVYSPQLVQKVGLSASDAATISVAVNIGSGTGGLPAGVLIDRAGPQIAIVVGSLCIFLGYFSLNMIYVHEILSLPLICILMVFVGFGSVTSFFAGLKAVQANFPNHRGSAGALPIGAYGLAATLFSIIAAKFFDGQTGDLLAFLAFFCGSIAFIGSWFVHVYPKPSGLNLINLSSALCLSEMNDETPRTLKKRHSLAGSFSFWGVGTRLREPSFVQLPTREGASDTTVDNSIISVYSAANDLKNNSEESSVSELTFEANSRLPRPPSQPGVIEEASGSTISVIKDLFKNRTYMIQFCILTLSSGICQTYIYTVGFIVTAQFEFGQLKGSPATLQALQVSTISLASFGGRVTGGLLSDFLHKQLKSQRQWVILFALTLTFVTQFIVMNSNTIHLVTLASLLTGSAYGLIYGCYPAIIADLCGTENFTTAWGLGCCGPLIVLFSLEKVFGSIYDSHSKDGICSVGNECYQGAFKISSTLCVLAAIVTAGLMYRERRY